MNSTILKINDSIFCSPNDKVGVISICKNNDGCKLICFVEGITDVKKTLNKGDTFDIKLISKESSERLSAFIMPQVINQDYCDHIEDIEGMVLATKNETICMPFTPEGVTSVLITSDKGNVYINAGGLTSEKILLDYYYSDLNEGDNIVISIEKLNNISEPVNKRRYTGCNKI